MSPIDENRVDIAIIGGGCSGALTAVHLVDQFVQDKLSFPLSIVLIDDGDKPARGVAYGTNCIEHLLNVPAKGMSGLARDPAHFADWLARQDPASKPETFAPRMIYGDYLAELLSRATQVKKESLRLQVIRDRAVDVEISNNKPRIRLASGISLNTARIVLALGNFPPENSQFAANIDASSRHRFHDNPWKSSLYDAVLQDDEIFLIGTGLTMIDVVLQLRAAGHHGRLHAVSRHGYLPQAHFDYTHLATEKPTSYLPAPMPRDLLQAFKAVRRSVTFAESEAEGNWRCVMNEVRNETSAIWQQSSNADKRRFLRHLRQLWEVHRHRMAPQIAAQMGELIDSGILNVCAGRLLGFVSLGASLKVSIKPRGGEAIRDFTVSHVVNCTGPKTELRAIHDPFVDHLLGNGLLRADELGLGASVDASGALVDRFGAVSDCLYTIGSLRKGELWESTAVPEIREQASAIAAFLLRTMPDASTSLCHASGEPNVSSAS